MSPMLLCSAHSPLLYCCALQVLGWRPKWSVQEGLKKTIEYFTEELKKA